MFIIFTDAQLEQVERKRAGFCSSFSTVCLVASLWSWPCRYSQNRVSLFQIHVTETKDQSSCSLMRLIQFINISIQCYDLPLASNSDSLRLEGLSFQPTNQFSSLQSHIRALAGPFQTHPAKRNILDKIKQTKQKTRQF